MKARRFRCCVCDRSYDPGTGCTNRCCITCHKRFCTPGGITSPGHNINVDVARATFRKTKVAP